MNQFLLPKKTIIILILQIERFHYFYKYNNFQIIKVIIVENILKPLNK
jgi:hypothetical protein